MRHSIGDSLGSVTELAKVQTDSLQWMTLGLGVAPSALELDPVLGEGSAGDVRRVQDLGIFPRRPRSSKAVDVIESGHSNESVLSRSCPQTMGSFGSKQNGVFVGREDSAWKDGFLEDPHPSLLTAEFKRSCQAIKLVVRTSVMGRHVHLLKREMRINCGEHDDHGIDLHLAQVVP